jgi:hypothetical protein
MATSFNRAPIFADTFSLCQWLLQHFDREPSMLARRLCDNVIVLLEVITLALRDHLRDERLDEADERLIALRLHLRLASETGLLNEQQLLFALDGADRIGRQLGGWQRSLDRAY